MALGWLPIDLYHFNLLDITLLCALPKFSKRQTAGEHRDNWNAIVTDSDPFESASVFLPSHPQPLVGANDSVCLAMSVPPMTEDLTLASVHFASSFLTSSCIVLLPRFLLCLLL